jgi:HEAT repeat protein
VYGDRHRSSSRRTLDRLAGEPPEGRRRLLMQLVLARLPREAEAVLARLPALDTRLARDLARGLVARAPERSNEVARALLAQRDESLRLEGLATLEAAPGDVPLRPLCELLRDPSEAVRVRAAEVLGRRGDESIFDAVRATLEEDRALSPREADALGRTLAEIAPIAAARLFAGWLEPKARFLRGLSSQQRAQQWAAVAGTGNLPGTDPRPTLTSLANRSGGELRRHCLDTLARHRKAAHVPRG